MTAYVRRRLWDAILACGEDFCYCDTDSCKFEGYHQDYFEEDNKRFREKLYTALDFNGIEHEMVEPKGQLLGAWHLEGEYRRFKTLGCKRYLVEE